MKKGSRKKVGKVSEEDTSSNAFQLAVQSAIQTIVQEMKQSKGQQSL